MINAPPRDREVEAEKARERSRARSARCGLLGAQLNAAGLRGPSVSGQIAPGASAQDSNDAVQDGSVPPPECGFGHLEGHFTRVNAARSARALKCAA